MAKDRNSLLFAKWMMPTAMLKKSISSHLADSVFFASASDCSILANTATAESLQNWRRFSGLGFPAPCIRAESKS